MPDVFDPYYKWLAIPPDEQPANHYRLLGLKAFESNPEVIETAADRQMGHVRSFQVGKHAAESQKLLNELSAARLCLLSADKKTVYDQSLRVKFAQQQPVAPPAAPAPPAGAASIAPKPIPAQAKPVRLAQAQPLRPVQAPAASAGSLDFDPLDQSNTPRHKRRKTAAPQPALLVGAGAAVLAVVGLIWVLVSGGGDPPKQLSAKPPHSASPPASDVFQDDSSSAVADRNTRPNRIVPAKSTKSPTKQESDNDASLSSRTESGDVELDDADDSVMPAVDDNDDLNSAGVESAEPDAAAPRTALPDADAMKAAIAEVQSLFKSEFSAAKKPDQKIALAEKLLGLAKESDAPVERYALLSEAQRLATSAGAFGLAMQAIDAIAEEFDIERLTLAAEMVDAAGDKEMPAAARKELIEIVLPLVDEAVAAGQFKLARRLATAGLAAARKANASDAAKTLARQAHDLAAQEKRAEAAEAARKLLETKPDDAEAHLTLGKYLCLVVGDWDAGLPHLKQGSDANLRSNAERELEGAESATDRMKLGDLWWDLADEQKGANKDRYRARAGYWYQQAVSELIGLSKTKVEKRLADLPTLPQAAPPGRSTTAKVLYLSDLNAEEVQIFAGEPLRGKYELKVAGVASPHAILTHPARGRAHVAFQLPNGCHAFLGQVGVSNYIDPWRVVGPLVFRVVADGKELWRSRPFQSSKDAAQDFNIPLRSASKLELIVDCGGHDNYSHGVWFEPRVTTAGVSNSKPPLGEKGHMAVGKWIDLLPLVDPVQQHLEAAWHRTPAGLHVDKPLKPIQLPLRISGDYTLHVEFTRLVGGDGVVVILPALSKQCMLAMSVANGEMSGLEVINNQYFGTSPATIRPGTLENGHHYSLDVTVRQRGAQLSIESKLDDQPFVRWNGEVSSLSLWRDWNILPRPDVIALAANDATDFHVAKFKLLSGKATIDAELVPRASLPNVAPVKNPLPSNAKNDLLKGAVLLTTFDEPTILRKKGEVRVRDVSGKQKPGLVVGAEFVPGKSGRALKFQKAGDHVDFGNDLSLSPASFTFCAWVMPAPHDNPWTDVFSKHSDGQGGAGLVVRIDTNRPEFGIGMGDSQWHFLRPGVLIPLEQWAHVAATHDVNTSSIYINGQLAKSAPSDGAVLASPAQCYIGLTRDHDELQFYGLIDELALFDRALSADEIQHIYELGTKGKSLAAAAPLVKPARSADDQLATPPSTIEKKPAAEKKPANEHPAASAALPAGARLYLSFAGDTTSAAGDSIRVNDLSGRSNSATSAGAAALIKGKVGQALALNGGELRVTPVLNGLANFTVSVWLCLTGNEEFIVYEEGNAGGPAARILVSPAREIELEFWHFNGPPDNWLRSHTKADAVPAGKWCHLAVRMVDGAPKSGKAIVTINGKSSELPAQSVSGHPPTFARIGGAGRAMVDEVVIFDRALTDAELNGVYQTGLKQKMLVPAK